MPSSTTLAALVAHCRKLARRQHAPDAELLRRFLRQRDNAAFEELVERYAPLVWGVCRRIVRGESDCEDAFQAVFLALFRQASTIDPQRPLGAWLHGVSVHAAHKAAARSARQPTLATVPERASSGDIADELGNRELFRIVDEEIARLPALLREPFVLCCLEGRTRDEAAAMLGCSVTTIKGRLERSRNLLRRHLERRGIGLPAAFLALGLTGGHVRASLRAKAFHSAFGSAPATIAALVPTAGVSLTSKLTLVAISFAMIGVLGFGALRVMQNAPPQEAPAQAKKSPQSPAAENPQPPLDRFGDPLPPGAIRRFGTLRFRHYEIVHISFTPDGKKIIAGSGRTPLAVFDAATGQKLREVGKVSSNNYAGYALSPDGKRVACCGSDVYVWDLETGRLIRALGCGRCHAVAFSPDGKKIAAVKELLAEGVVVEAATGKQLGQWTLKQGKPMQYIFDSLAFSPDGKYLAGVLHEFREENEKSSHFRAVSSHVCLLDATTGALARTIGSADDPIHKIAFQPGTGRLAGDGKDGVLRFWDVETGKEVHRLRAIKDVSHLLLFSADGRGCLAVDRRDRFLLVLDANNGKELRRVQTGSPPPSSMGFSRSIFAFSPDGRTAAAAKSVLEARVRVWDIESGRERLADAGHDGPATLSLSADGRTLISRDRDEQFFHWDLRSGTGQRQRSTVEEKIGRTSHSATDQIYTTTLRGARWQFTINHTSMKMEARERKSSRLLGRAKMPTAMRGFAVSPDGTHLAVSFQDARYSVFLWNPEKEEAPHILSGHPDACQQLLFSHDGKRLIAGAGTHNAYSSPTVWIWDVATARIVHKLATNSAPGHLLLTADDRVLLSGGLWNDAAVHAWDMETGKELARLADPSLKYTSELQGTQSQLAINGLSLSADERFLAIVSSQDNTSAVSIWETSSWKLVRAFAPTQPRYHSESMLFSYDDRSLFVANSDSTILEWDVSGRFAKKTETPNRDRLNVLWQALREKSDKAYPAAWEMVDHPAESVPFLIDKVSPVKPVEERRVRQLLAQLDSESFAEREEASRKLLALGEQIEPMLRQALKERPSLEMKKRVEGAIEALNRLPTPEQLRLLRALAVLEWSNRPEAVAHLRRLAGGAASARLTRAAKAAWQRR